MVGLDRRWLCAQYHPVFLQKSRRYGYSPGLFIPEVVGNVYWIEAAIFRAVSAPARTIESVNYAILDPDQGVRIFVAMIKDQSTADAIHFHFLIIGAIPWEGTTKVVVQFTLLANAAASSALIPNSCRYASPI